MTFEKGEIDQDIVKNTNGDAKIDLGKDLSQENKKIVKVSKSWKKKKFGEKSTKIKKSRIWYIECRTQKNQYQSEIEQQVGNRRKKISKR